MLGSSSPAPGRRRARPTASRPCPRRDRPRRRGNVGRWRRPARRQQVEVDPAVQHALPEVAVHVGVVAVLVPQPRAAARRYSPRRSGGTAESSQPGAVIGLAGRPSRSRPGPTRGPSTACASSSGSSYGVASASGSRRFELVDETARGARRTRRRSSPPNSTSRKPRPGGSRPRASGWMSRWRTSRTSRSSIPSQAMQPDSMTARHVVGGGVDIRVADGDERPPGRAVDEAQLGLENGHERRLAADEGAGDVEAVLRQQRSAGCSPDTRRGMSGKRARISSAYRSRIRRMPR